MSSSRKAHQLAEAYNQTRYRVWREDGPALDLYPGQHNVAMDAWLHLHAAPLAHVISACNPRSQLLPEPENRARMRTLESTVRQRGWFFLEARGEALNENWPGEASLLVIGQSREELLALAEQHGQYAILEHPYGMASQLVFSRLFAMDHAQVATRE